MVDILINVMYAECWDLYGNSHLVPKGELVDRPSAYGVYMVDDDSVLMVQDPRSLRWELPGGGIEDGETSLEGLAREFTEETGLEICGNTIELTKWTEYFYETTLQQGWRSNREFYIIETAEGKLLENGNGDDAAAARFIALNAMSELVIMPRIRHVIEFAKTYKSLQ